MFTSLALEQGRGNWDHLHWLFSFLVLGSLVGPDLGPRIYLIPWERRMWERGRVVHRVHCVPIAQSSPEDQLLSLYIIYTVGYALSFSALVIASAILLGFR